MEWRVVSGGGDNDVKLWDIQSGHVTNTLSGHTQEVVRLRDSLSYLHFIPSFSFAFSVLVTSSHQLQQQIVQFVCGITLVSCFSRAFKGFQVEKYTNWRIYICHM